MSKHNPSYDGSASLFGDKFVCAGEPARQATIFDVAGAPCETCIALGFRGEHGCLAIGGHDDNDMSPDLIVVDVALGFEPEVVVVDVMKGMS